MVKPGDNGSVWEWPGVTSGEDGGSSCERDERGEQPGRDDGPGRTKRETHEKDDPFFVGSSGPGLVCGC
jgi:hypothetical protein